MGIILLFPTVIKVCKSANTDSQASLLQGRIYVEDVTHPLRTCHYKTLLPRQCTDDIVLKSNHFLYENVLSYQPTYMQIHYTVTIIMASDKNNVYTVMFYIMCLFRLREGVRKMEEKHFSEHNDEHVEFLPVEWRSKLALDGGL